MNRRQFLLGAGGTLTIGATAIILPGTGIFTSGNGGNNPELVEYDGWILTLDDKKFLEKSIERMEFLEGVDLPGGDIGNQKVNSKDACAELCMETRGCHSFTYAKPTHPSQGKRDMCWIKSSDKPPKVKSRNYISGVRRKGS